MTNQDYHRQKYERLNPDWEDSLTIYKNLIHAELGPEATLLDIGCGHADFLKDIYQQTPHTYGLDPDSQTLAKNQFLKHKVTGSADQMPFEDDFFDVIILSWVVEHLTNPIAGFQEIYRVLRPGGKVAFITPNTYNPVVWINRLIPDFLHDRLTRHLYGRQEGDTYPIQYKMNSVKAIRATLGRIGFQEVDLILNEDPSYLSFNTISFKISCWLEKLLPRRMKVHLIGIFQKPLTPPHLSPTLKE